MPFDRWFWFALFAATSCGRLNYTRSGASGDAFGSGLGADQPPLVSDDGQSLSPETNDSESDAPQLDDAVPEDSVGDDVGSNDTVSDDSISDDIAGDDTISDDDAVDEPPNDGGVSVPSGPVEPLPDPTPGSSLPPLDCVSTITWEADFSTDPTALDANGDGTPDWIMRDRAPFEVNELQNGVWRAPISRALDTNPPMNYLASIQVTVLMKDLNPPDTPQLYFGYAGALFWINYGYTAEGLIPVFASTVRSDETQQALGLYGKDANAINELGAPYPVPASEFVLFEMFVDAVAGTASYWVDAVSMGTVTPTRAVLNNSDMFATLIAPSGNAEFDYVRVATCLP
jgi:hypothetical protein